MTKQQLLDAVRAYLRTLPTDEARLDFIEALGVCLSCGTLGHVCKCLQSSSREYETVPRGPAR